MCIRDRVIKTVEEVAERQNMKSLKVTGRNKTLILPANWIAGVDYELDNNDADEDDGDHNDWVDNVTEDNNNEDNELPKEETEPVTNEEIRQLREEEAQRALNKT